MPTILRFGGLRVVVYPNDHRPEHVHVIGNDAEAVFLLGCPRGAILLRENYNFGRAEIAWIRRVLKQHQQRLCREWARIHGIEG